ncbi:uncharacterized protein LOC131849146 [Achroia grisella]|uniref:uncharacterized protein LOC131849146 n=1 Tax=Achroia grisella TaxID=688607 RepID=UPI0027D2D511|nr:uncharacterized protein LOC131849146 [Achroia grisella]
MSIGNIFLYTTLWLISIFSTTGSISITFIIHFKCSACINKCCAGSLVFPRFILSSAFCAQSCHSVLMRDLAIPINKTFIHPQYKKYRKEQRLMAKNDIALIMITSHPKAATVKLSAIEVVSAIGLKALIPILDDRKPRLLATVIQSCSKHLHLRGYHICSFARLPNTILNKCQQTKGLPLLIDGRIIGLSSSLDTKVCDFPQKIFTAITPYIPWIRLVIENNIYNALQDGSQVITNSNTSYYTSQLKAQTITLDKNNSVKRYFKHFEHKEIPVIPLSAKVKFSAAPNEATKPPKKLKMDTKTSTIITTSMSKATDYIQKDIAESTHMLISESNIKFAEISDASLHSSYNYSAMRIATNAMEWFNKNIRSKLNDGPPPLLILTTPKIVYTKEFLDLT